MARATFGNEEVAARIALRNPVYNEGLVKGFLEELAKDVLDAVVNGNQVRIANLFTCHISLTGRLDSPDAPLPPLEDCLQVKFYPSKQLVEGVRQGGQAEKEAMSEKLPVIANTEDTVWKLKDVINLGGALRLTGTDLFFNPEDEGCECVLEGTHNGRVVQSRFVSISASEITLLPDVVTQTSAWNNEYILSVSTHYTENGTLRTGVYRRRLRTPLNVTLGNSTGILSGSETSPLVTVMTGTFSTGGYAQVRIQAVVGQDGDLRFSLLDMSENGSVGPEVLVPSNGGYSLTGFPGSDLTSLDVIVNDYPALLKMVKNPYGNRLVDILEVSAGA
jgi:hypothetical protein